MKSPKQLIHLGLPYRWRQQAPPKRQ